jgi:hypothetical protein
VAKVATAALLSGAAMLFVSGAAQAAQAVDATRGTGAGSQFASEAPWAVPNMHNQLQWDAKGRWGLRLDMNRPTNREADIKDAQAGVFFRITPSLQVGGAVALGDRLADPKLTTPQDATPRVHLETAFRF